MKGDGLDHIRPGADACVHFCLHILEPDCTQDPRYATSDVYIDPQLTTDDKYGIPGRVQAGCGGSQINDIASSSWSATQPRGRARRIISLMSGVGSRW